MVLNEQERNRLADVIARRQATLGGASGSAPAVPLTVARASSISAPAKKNKGMVAVDSDDDEDTGEGLVLKRPRVGVVATSLSATDGHPSSFKDNPPNASSPRTLLTLEGSGESTPGDDQVPLAPELPALIQHALKCFLEKEAAEALGGDLLKECMGQSLGEFLVNSLAFMS